MEEKIFKLYKECFDKQSEEFQEFFVEQNYNGNNVSTFVEDDEPIAMVFVNDDTLKFFDSEVKSVVLSGLCVKKSEQHKGFGSKLISKTLKEQREKGISVVRMMPPDDSINVVCGFVPYCFAQTKVVLEKIDGSRILKFEDAQQMLELYNSFCEKFYIKPTRTLQQMQSKIVEYLKFGFAMGVFRGDKLLAYSLEKTQGNGLEVCFCEREALKILGISTMEEASSNGKVKGLICVVNIEKFLQEIKFHKEFEIDWKIKFTDDFLEENNVTLRVTVKNGNCKIEKLEQDDFDIEYIVEDFVSTVVRSFENLNF